MSQRDRAIIFGVAGTLLLIVGAVGLISALSNDDDGDAVSGPTSSDRATPTSTIPAATTTQAIATTTEVAATNSTSAPTTVAVTTTLPAATNSTSAPSTTSAPTTVAATTTLPATTTTIAPTTTTTTIALEDPEVFVNALIAAQAAGDVDFLLARLHPDVLTRYGGVEPCQTYLASTSFPAITLREIVDPAPWDYTTDDVITTFPEAIGVEIQRVVGGETIIQELHIVYSGSELRWFTDCGDPV